MKTINYFKKLDRRGFTMIEMLLCMGIFSILLIVLLQIFTAILYVHAESQTTSSIDQEGNYLLSRLSYDIHQASTVTSPTWGNTDNNLQVGSMKYQISGNKILVTDAYNIHSQLNGADVNVTGTFTTLGNPSKKLAVKINLTIDSKINRIGGAHFPKTFETTVQTR